MKINSNYNYSYQHIKEMFAEINEKIASLPTALVAGDNITIENGVISATDTKYTAGTGITISDENVISASGGGTKLYKHKIDFFGEFEGDDTVVNIYVINTKQAPYTLNEIINNIGKWSGTTGYVFNLNLGTNSIVFRSTLNVNNNFNFTVTLNNAEVTITLPENSFTLDTVVEL